MTSQLVMPMLDESRKQKTLADSFTISGKGTFTGLPCQMQLHPAPANTGITIITDGVTIPCNYEFLLKEQVHTTSFTREGLIVRSLEHLLSSLYLHQIDNCIIETVIGNEVPNNTGGSAIEYAEAIAESGYEELGEPVRAWQIVADGTFRWEDSVVRVEPPFQMNPELSVDITVDFPLPIGVQQAQWCDTPRNDANSPDGRKYVRARSFLRRDLDYVWPDGRNHWTVLHDSILGLPKKVEDLKQVAFNMGSWVVEPYFPDEPVWHKMMDCVGDLSLIGGRLYGKVTISRPGHAFNHRVLPWLLGKYRPEIPITARLD
jgi:UDP-3-O-[3-hydroxymyristoyl] N-acetylglucosamine deacetylase